MEIFVEDVLQFRSISFTHSSCALRWTISCCKISSSSVRLFFLSCLQMHPACRQLTSEDSSEHWFFLVAAAFGLSFLDRQQQLELGSSTGTVHSFSTAWLLSLDSSLHSYNISSIVALASSIQLLSCFCGFVSLNI